MGLFALLTKQAEVHPAMNISDKHLKEAEKEGGCVQCGCVICGHSSFSIFILTKPDRIILACAKCETPLTGFNEVLNAE